MLRKLFFLVCVLFCIVSCTSAPSQPPARGPAAVAELSRATVALVGTFRGQVRPFCTGTWISSTEILTAAHCVYDNETGETTDSVPYRISEDGKTYRAGLVRFDAAADLALLEDVLPPLHRSAPIAMWSPAQGAELHIMAHLRGLWFSYMHGYVSDPARKYTTSLGIEGPFLQAEAPIVPGASGGGAFNSNGELVGVCSFSRSDIPGAGFYIAVPAIQKFLRTK